MASKVVKNCYAGRFAALLVFIYMIYSGINCDTNYFGLVFCIIAICGCIYYDAAHTEWADDTDDIPNYNFRDDDIYELEYHEDDSWYDDEDNVIKGKEEPFIY